jgi:hypothetical protein
VAEIDPGPVPGEEDDLDELTPAGGDAAAPSPTADPAPAAAPVAGGPDPEAELDITLPPPAAQEDPSGGPAGHICQDDPSWPGADE